MQLKNLPALMRTKMARDVTWVFIAQSVNTVTGVLLGVVLARALTIEDFGRHQLALSFIGLIQIAGMPGLNLSVTRAALNGNDAFFFKALRRSLCVSIAVACALGGVAFFGKNILGQWLIPVCAAMLFVPIAGLEKHESLLQGKRDFASARKIAVFSSLSGLVVVGSTAWITQNYLYALLAYLVSRACTLLVAFYLINLRSLTLKNVGSEQDDVLFSIGLKNTWVAGFNIIIGQLDKVILGALNPAMLAVYQIGAMIPIRMKDKLKELLVVPVTHWASKTGKQYASTIIGHSYLFFSFGTLITMGLWAAAGPLVALLYGDKYADAVPILKTMSLIFPVHLWGTAVLNIDLYKRSSSFYQKSVYISHLVYLPVLLFSVRHFGPLGAAISFVFRVYMMNFFFPLILVWKLRRERINGLNGESP